jgi:hypothetical protein
VCYLFRFNPLLRKCFDHDQPFACFEDGRVRKDRCLPRFWGLRKLFLCRRGLNNCKNKCWDQYYWQY